MKKTPALLGMVFLMPATLLWLMYTTIAASSPIWIGARGSEDIWYMSGVIALAALGATSLLALWRWLCLCWSLPSGQVHIRSWQLVAVLLGFVLGIPVFVRASMLGLWVFPVTLVAPMFMGLVMVASWRQGANQSSKRTREKPRAA